MDVNRSAGESADLKQALKHDPVTPELRALADSLEGDEAVAEVLGGWDTAAPGSYVAEVIAAES
jgi:hypothetical protein